MTLIPTRDVASAEDVEPRLLASGNKVFWKERQGSRDVMDADDIEDLQIVSDEALFIGSDNNSI